MQHVSQSLQLIRLTALILVIVLIVLIRVIIILIVCCSLLRSCKLPVDGCARVLLVILLIFCSVTERLSCKSKP